MTGKITSRAIGLDIGTSGIRAAELRHIRGSATCEVSRLAAVDLPHGTVRNGEVLDPKLFTKSLRSLWKKGRFTGRSVTFGISDTSIITRQLDLPWMPPDSFIQALPYQIHEALPVDISTVEVLLKCLMVLPHLLIVLAGSLNLRLAICPLYLRQSEQLTSASQGLPNHA